MEYNISLSSPTERAAIIKTAVSATDKVENFYDYRNTNYPLPLIRISIDIPIYRVENFRTFTDQSEYIKSNRLDENYFRIGQENESVQQAQHELLVNLAKKGKDNSVSAVIDVLRKDKQREPLLITADGIVVNGNRRLAAMRELAIEGNSDNDCFKHVDLLVLPADATPEDILDIEASLQGKPETKLDYDWIGDAQLIKSQLNIHKNISDVARRLNRTEKDIKNTLHALAEADLYLKEWKKTEGSYLSIKDDAEQFFKDLPKYLEGKDTQLENLSRLIAWRLFDNKDNLPGRLYDYNAAFGKLTEEVVEKFSEKLNIEISGNDIESDIDNYSVNIDSIDDGKNYDSITEILKDNDNKEALTCLIESTVEAVEGLKGQRSGDAALKAIMQAHSKLASVDLSKAHSNTFPAIQKQLEHISSVTQKLLDKITNSI